DLGARVPLEAHGLGEAPDRLADLARPATDAEARRVALVRVLRDVVPDQLDSHESLHEPRQPPHRAHLPVEVHERHVAFGGAVELDDARNSEALLERLPDLRAEPVSDADSPAVASLVGMLGRVEEVAAELADVLEGRRLEAGAVAPEAARREPP